MPRAKQNKTQAGLLLTHKKGKKMTKLDFISLCGELLIDPDVALSDDNVEQMLLDRADDELQEYLKNEF